MQYIDIHSHLNFKDYENDLPDVLARLKETDTHTIVVGTDYELSKSAVELAEQHDNLYACVGMHPVDKQRIFEIEKFEELIKYPKVVAVGECGMDFYHAKKEEDHERQKQLFSDQIHLALKHNKPIMIHARNAYDEILEILEPLKREQGDTLRGNVHFFAGDMLVAKRFIDIGFTLSFTGVITFARDYDEVIQNAPLTSIMSETDAPYVAPVPYRGQRNEPSYVREVVHKITEIRGEDVEVVKTQLVANACRVFGLVLE